MPLNINCRHNDHGVWCKNKKIKRSLWGLGSRICAVADGKACELQEEFIRPPAPLGPPKPKPENHIDLGKLSDGYHTFDELYEHRHVLFLALMKAHPEKSWFSSLHEDGTMFVGMFICGIELPTGMVTYHLPNGFLETAEATGAKRLDFAPAWDGHTSKDVVDRGQRLCSSGRPKMNTVPRGTFGDPEYRVVESADLEKELSRRVLSKEGIVCSECNGMGRCGDKDDDFECREYGGVGLVRLGF